MNFKIDTKEKFTVITPLQFHLSDNLTAELNQTATNCLQTDIKNVVLNMKEVVSLDEAAATNLMTLQQSFYESNTSFVICEMQPAVSEKLEQMELLEIMNITPTESEAWDIVQMEEIERELMDGFDDQK
ncbi:STAS domain-containing protein [Panacibacter ginsenosidivorans]|uniref:STAS domain-containing protein n=1 Tax=Panacibacter ginsenosidivorans TaxID=1813871 RepID=A0A5B8V786_9BACT|nr:STAS domain-containing protein [Panacibacter ginsenosidivorans]QEC67182.1 STAS domain-containing protein [Panacibacter ginsenosidivorans]